MKLASLLPPRFRGLGGDERGTSLIEMGIIAPVLGLLVMGITDLGRGLSERFTMQQAVNRSLERLLADPPEAGKDATDVDYQYLIDDAEVAAGVGDGQVTIRRWLQCEGQDAESYDSVCTAGEETARYLELTIRKDFVGDFYFGTVPMTATGAVRIQ